MGTEIRTFTSLKEQTLNTQNIPQLDRLRGLENNILNQTDRVFNDTQSQLPDQPPHHKPPLFSCYTLQGSSFYQAGALLSGNTAFKFINPKTSKRILHRRRFMSTIPTEVSRVDAENATSLTADFLKRLGYKGSWLPMKVSLDGELYVVEMMFQKLTAKVQINSKTKEIKEYELQEGEGASNSLFKSKGKIIFLVAAISITIAVVKLIGIF